MLPSALTSLKAREGCFVGILSHRKTLQAFDKSLFLCFDIGINLQPQVTEAPLFIARRLIRSLRKAVKSEVPYETCARIVVEGCHAS
jgi:hypothetical protein